MNYRKGISTYNFDCASTEEESWELRKPQGSRSASSTAGDIPLTLIYIPIWCMCNEVNTMYGSTSCRLLVSNGHDIYVWWRLMNQILWVRLTWLLEGINWKQRLKCLALTQTPLSILFPSKNTIATIALGLLSQVAHVQLYPLRTWGSKPYIYPVSTTHDVSAQAFNTCVWLLNVHFYAHMCTNGRDLELRLCIAHTGTVYVMPLLRRSRYTAALFRKIIIGPCTSTSSLIHITFSLTCGPPKIEGSLVQYI